MRHGSLVARRLSAVSPSRRLTHVRLFFFPTWLQSCCAMDGVQPTPFGYLVESPDIEECSGLPARDSVIAYSTEDLQLELDIVVASLLRHHARRTTSVISTNPLAQRVDAYALRFGSREQTAGSLLIGLDGFELLLVCVLDHSESPGSSRFRGSDQLLVDT